jgi:hypothetical protein
VGRTKARSTTCKPTLAARIDRAVYRLLRNELPLRLVGDGCDPEPVLHACQERLRDLASAAGKLAAAITEQVGPVRTDRLAEALGRARVAGINGSPTFGLTAYI